MCRLLIKKILNHKLSMMKYNMSIPSLIKIIKFKIDIMETTLTYSTV